jgi:hypothetical protein
MMSRRELLAGGAAGTLAGEVAGAAAQDTDAQYLSRILDELRGIHRAVSFGDARGLASIRLARRTYFKNTGRFPEFVDVGFDVYESVIDWLVAMQQPVAIDRQADGKYTVALYGTTIVLRSDFPDDYVGQGYDK